VKTFVATDVSRVSETESSDNSYTSHIALIRSCNLAGTVNNDGIETDITISLGDGPNLVAVTGETGSGKSLLIAKAADLLTGGKAASSSLSSATQLGDTPFVEMVLRLSEPHLTMVQQSLESIGINPAVLFESNTTGDLSVGTLILKRSLALENGRIKSTCAINGQATSLKALCIVSRPLLAIVDAAVAAAALAKQNSRMSIIDTAVPPPVLSFARLTRAEYRKCRGYRQRLENELSNRMLPVSMSSDDDDDKDIELLQHWIDELDAFEQRMAAFCSSVGGQMPPSSNMATAAERLSSTSWFDDSASDDIEETFSSQMYTNLVEFREAVKSLDNQVEAARHALDALSSLSSPESAITALERTRNQLFDATGNEPLESPLSLAAERSHDLLNKVERALKACVSSLEEDRGILSILENTRSSIPVSLEDIEIILADWNTLARKHGMTPFALPACHKALRSELTGNVEARLLLPEAVTAEAEALDNFQAACSMLTSARQKVAKQLSVAVSRRLPSLGMDGSTFVVDFHKATRKCTDISAYAANARLGVDSIDFLLLHGLTNDSDGVRDTAEKSSNKGGKVDVVASSGEKARILLAIECELPGSIGAINCATSWNDTGVDLALYTQADTGVTVTPPVSVIYDEIDAHVGGRAAVAMANMLGEQTSGRGNNPVKGQVVSITHSPSVAAVADIHILIQRHRNGNEGRVPVSASIIDGVERRKELARMASGDLAPDEAETFADALLRDGAKRKKS
jgi:DNA repair ATPase RecN